MAFSFLGERVITTVGSLRPWIVYSLDTRPVALNLGMIGVRMMVTASLAS